jgi:hypothetical protein
MQPGTSVEQPARTPLTWRSPHTGSQCAQHTIGEHVAVHDGRVRVHPYSRFRAAARRDIIRSWSASRTSTPCSSHHAPRPPNGARARPIRRLLRHPPPLGSPIAVHDRVAWRPARRRRPNPPGPANRQDRTLAIWPASRVAPVQVYAEPSVCAHREERVQVQSVGDGVGMSPMNAG